MKYLSCRFAGILSPLVLILCAAFQIAAQVSDEAKVPVVQEIGSRYSRCWNVENRVYDEDAFKKLAADKNCSYASEKLKVDFKKHTLIGYEARGDCFIHADAEVFRSDKTKTYSVKIRNVWGGCRAGGSFEGWLVIEKIPPGYKVEFSETRVNNFDRVVSEGKTFPVIENEILETRSFEMKSCIQTIYTKQFVIRDNETFLKTVRNDASRKYCIENLEKIDFAKHTLLGIEINSGYCRMPIGLEYKTIKDPINARYLVEISYIDPKGSTCRALSEYDLWLLVPKIPEDYEVKFDVKAREK